MSKYTINNNIRRLRFEAEEMTQQQLADRIGVSRQTIVAIENKKNYPSLELAFRIARAFQTPLEEVFSYEYMVDKTYRQASIFNGFNL